MVERLDGTVVLVTGVSSGIGEATAKALVEQGAALALVARREVRLEQLAGDITRDGGRALVVAADVTEKAQAQADVARTLAELGRQESKENGRQLDANRKRVPQALRALPGMAQIPASQGQHA
jgi:NAD(P)-dependent dehydrogenase (short-subunit alcohol dehydrogenase family)